MSDSLQNGLILNLLKNAKNHYSAEEIQKKLMTVYRNINKLVKKGEVLELHINHVAHYCGNTGPHYHLHCINCGEIKDIYISEDEIQHTRNIASKDSFSPILNAVVIKGICKEYSKMKEIKC